MIKVSIHYPNTQGSRFDTDYYLNTHMPMAIAKLGPALKGVSVDIGVSGGGPETPPAYAAMCHLLFETVETFYGAFMPHADALQGDIPNYTDVTPIIQISDVRIAR
ncbi:EthD family reductase [Azospirillum sp. sgz301742]